MNMKVQKGGFGSLSATVLKLCLFMMMHLFVRNFLTNCRVMAVLWHAVSWHFMLVSMVSFLFRAYVLTTFTSGNLSIRRKLSPGQSTLSRTHRPPSSREETVSVHVFPPLVLHLLLSIQWFEPSSPPPSL